jgi:hypothetical protein
MAGGGLADSGGICSCDDSVPGVLWVFTEAAGVDAEGFRMKIVNRHRKLTHHRRRILTHPERVKS